MRWGKGDILMYILRIMPEDISYKAMLLYSATSVILALWLVLIVSRNSLQLQ